MPADAMMQAFMRAQRKGTHKRYSWMAPYNMSSARLERRKPMTLPARRRGGCLVKSAAARHVGSRMGGQHAPLRKAVLNAGAMPRRASTAVRTLPYVPICSSARRTQRRFGRKEERATHHATTTLAAHHHAEVATDDGGELQAAVETHACVSAWLASMQER
jgi:hypothetical protein